MMVSRPRQKIRRTKKTILIVGEGPTDKAFLQHIKQLYVTREMDIAVKVECGSGGAPKSVVERTVRLKGSRSYDKCYVLVDADLPFEPDSDLEKRMRKRPRIEMLKATPCIEGLLLAILEYPDFSQQSTTSDKSKKAFKAKYLSEDKKIDKRSYERIFSRQIIEERRKAVPELDAILKAMEV